MKLITCPNCNDEFSPKVGHAADECVVAVLASIVINRGERTLSEINRLVKDVDIDTLWRDLGPVIDAFSGGEYSK